MKVDDKTHIPGKYTTALKSYDEMLENFRDISEYVIKELYKTYFRYEFHLWWVIRIWEGFLEWA